MYVVLVAPSGMARKGTAMGSGATFLRDIGINMASEAITREALIRELFDSTQYIQEKDGTVTTHASLTIYSQELTVFLGYNNLQLISDITDWYDCREKWTYRTKHQGTDDVIGVFVNLIGATTPSLIQNALPIDAVGGGLASRVIFVYEEEAEKPIAAPFPTTNTISLRKNLQLDLEEIYTTTGMYLVSDDFMSFWVPWYENQFYHPRFSDPNFAGYNSRRANHVLKLSMILSASENSWSKDGSKPLITIPIMERAIDLLERTEMKMPMTFMGFGQSKMAGPTFKIMKFIFKQKRTTRSEIVRIFFPDFGDMAGVDKALMTIRSFGFYKEVIKSNDIIYTYDPTNQYHGRFK